MAELIQHQTTLTGNMTLLCRFLRQKGFKIGATEEIDALKSLTYVPINNEKYFKASLKSILSKSEKQYKTFDELYVEFWDQLAKASNSKVINKPTKKDKKTEAQKKQAQFESLKSWLNLKPIEQEKEIASYSDINVLTKRNFSDLSEEELRLIMRILQRMAKKLNREKSRLKKKSKKHKNLDLKRTIRDSMRKGNELNRFIYSEKKEKKIKLVLLCDVSKSMDLYSRFFVHLIYAFQNSYDKIETFVFSTALHRVTEILDNYEFAKAFDIISDRVPQWSGGTTIGTCLQNFVAHHSHKLIDKKTIVLILSDGWDTGEPEVMKNAMKTIYKKSKKVIWLNPLAGNENFSPEVMGLQVALPYIDVLTSVHNLESLKHALQIMQKRRTIKT